jgi:hypothetical protein
VLPAVFLKIMSEEEVLKLKIYDFVEVKPETEGDLNQVGKIVTIDHWRRRVGLVNTYYKYAEFPYRKIVKKLRS